jgi:hypothetical protein
MARTGRKSKPSNQATTFLLHGSCHVAFRSKNRFKNSTLDHAWPRPPARRGSRDVKEHDRSVRDIRVGGTTRPTASAAARRTLTLALIRPHMDATRLALEATIRRSRHACQGRADGDNIWHLRLAGCARRPSPASHTCGRATRGGQGARSTCARRNRSRPWRCTRGLFRLSRAQRCRGGPIEHGHRRNASKRARP